ncbi:MAG: hypothetical protein H0W88_09930 [Parachlamydiaceae bacterium]|nr:hypothetical protein [Parachlamydiaceae bacterium]
MFFNQKPEDRFQQTKTKMQELSINMEKLDREYQILLSTLGLNIGEIQGYVENPENFTQPIWERLQNEKKKLDEKLNLAVNSVQDLRKTKKTQSENGRVQPTWIYVR